MMDGFEILAVIPARKGSKGLPGKNIRDLCGVPLIAHTIMQAIDSGCFSRVVVSTDDEEIAAVSMEFGAEVPFLRPGAMAGDRSDMRSAINHLLDELKSREGYSPDIFAILFPTYPFRTFALMEEVVNAAYTVAIWSQCAYPITTNPWELVAADGKSRWPAVRPLLEHTLVHPVAHASRRLLSLMGNIRAEVNLPPGVRQGDASAVERREYFRAKIAGGDMRFKNETCSAIVEDPVLRIDVNNKEDFLLAEQVIREGLFDLERHESRCHSLQ